jgi:hypothetical protein
VDRKAGTIGVGAVAVGAAGVALAAVALSDEGAAPSFPPPEQAGRTGPQPRRCPPPGPAVSLPDGRTLCGPEARRYIQRRNRRQTRLQNRLYGFTPARQRHARRILASDATLRALIGRRSRAPDRLGPWTHEGGTRAIGATAEYQLRSPIDIDETVPYVCANVRTLPEGRIRVHIRRVSSLHVLVHFARDRAVRIDPSSRAGAPEPRVVDYDPLPGSPRCPRSKH